MSAWPQLRRPAHLLCAGPPCQGWTRSGRNLGWLDHRIMPLVVLPMIALASGIPCSLIKEVPPFRAQGFTDWARLWDLVGYHFVTCEHEAAEANPSSGNIWSQSKYGKQCRSSQITRGSREGPRIVLFQICKTFQINLKSFKLNLSNRVCF